MQWFQWKYLRTPHTKLWLQELWFHLVSTVNEMKDKSMRWLCLTGAINLMNKKSPHFLVRISIDADNGKKFNEKWFSVAHSSNTNTVFITSNKLQTAKLAASTILQSFPFQCPTECFFFSQELLFCLHNFKFNHLKCINVHMFGKYCECNHRVCPEILIKLMCNNVKWEQTQRINSTHPRRISFGMVCDAGSFVLLASARHHSVVFHFNQMNLPIISNEVHRRFSFSFALRSSGCVLTTTKQKLSYSQLDEICLSKRIEWTELQPKIAQNINGE